MSEIACDAEERPPPNVRGIYGRGFYDGMKAAAAGATSMNSAKVRAITNSMTPQARKVFDAMPPNRQVRAGEVQALLKEDGVCMEMHIIAGCLNALVRDGAAKETGVGYFQRIEKVATLIANQRETQTVKAVPPLADPTQAPAPVEAAPAVPPPLDMPALTRLALLSSQLRIHADVLIDTVRKVTAIADAVDDLGLEVEQTLQNTHRDSEKFSQLRELLKSL